MRRLPALLIGALLAAPAFATTDFAVGPQYDSTHVYVAPDKVDAFVASFATTFGGHSSPQVVATVTPTPSSTSSQIVQTPSGIVSVFGFRTPVPYPFGSERTGYLVTDLDEAVKAAQMSGATTLVAPFNDPIGRDAVVSWPGGVNMQLYWHTKKPEYAALQYVPENRVYVPTAAADSFVRAFVRFAHGKVVSDVKNAPGADIGRNTSYRHILIESLYGKVAVFATDGQVPWPYGRELTGYEVGDLDATLQRATSTGATIIVAAHAQADRRSAMVEFPGGYVAEIHAVQKSMPTK
ncbi:putative enzyme related to lactoylglutathione lyase [Luteibacter sp. Sphag1AF]|uniref:glyoxalase n=1 Tax=Luteibacter sp. Sphag1AF TaxID=2587031 RepID=UPI00160F71F9|nr:glyoxalase [Luteibacter sp. Sphag1AF]MBB3228089.1 putative enzyme related to lactoylglutathione lyase [Luteibacter sp. Sphag1AF]